MNLPRRVARKYWLFRRLLLRTAWKPRSKSVNSIRSSFWRWEEKGGIWYPALIPMTNGWNVCRILYNKTIISMGEEVRKPSFWQWKGEKGQGHTPRIVMIVTTISSLDI